MNLLLIETSGNQSYIFGTNKLRENVGASELVYRACTQTVLESFGEDGIGGPKDLWSDDPSRLRRNLCSPRLNRPITDSGVNVEVIVATSGKALLLVKNREIGRKIIGRVTMRLLEQAPGLDVCGVLSDDFHWETTALNAVNKQAHSRLDDVRSSRPGPGMRFPRLPIIEDCRTSGLPAARVHAADPNDIVPRSAVSIRKWESGPEYKGRMKNLPGLSEMGIDFAENIGRLAETSDWLAVVHADGNGLGEVFLKFEKYAKCESAGSNREYVRKFRRFSLALDVCTERAFLSALQGLIARDAEAWFKQLILPLVLGGDDLTVVCDGACALQFTRDFLHSFENETARSQTIFGSQPDLAEFDLGDIIAQISNAAFGARHLSACAGVAIIKPHYPFSAAYDLAEELIRSAKQVKNIVTCRSPGVGDRDVPWPCSALDFHILYDSTASELVEIRRRLLVDDGTTQLCARPYVISERLQEVAGSDWARARSWETLKKRVEAILQQDENDDQRRALPNTQLHELRAGLFLGREAADARYRLMRHRYEDVNIGAFDEGEESLFFQNRGGRGMQATKFLDAMDASNFWLMEPKNREAVK
ncbi:MAG TPA: hypothetical protein VJX67_02015 [Blastocatellia bacterium]|nr:hypothetical protein [Blastocatellia bacterium]